MELCDIHNPKHDSDAFSLVKDEQTNTQTAAVQHVSGPSCWVTVTECVFIEFGCHKSLSFSLCLWCSCLGDRVRGGRPGQWQSETGGEFTVDTLHVFVTFRLFSSCWVWHIHSAAGRHWDMSLYSAWQWKSNFWTEMKREEVRQLRFCYVWIPPLN